MPTPPEFVRCGKDALLQVVERKIAGLPLARPRTAGGGLRGPCRGSLHEGIPRRGWPWRGTVRHGVARHGMAWQGMARLG